MDIYIKPKLKLNLKFLSKKENRKDFVFIDIKITSFIILLNEKKKYTSFLFFIHILLYLERQTKSWIRLN